MSDRDAWVRRVERLLLRSVAVLEARLADGNETSVGELTKAIASCAEMCTSHRALVVEAEPTPRKRKPRRKPGGDAP